MTGLWIVGAGGVGREALDVALAAGVEVAGFLDDAPGLGTVRGLPCGAWRTRPPGPSTWWPSQPRGRGSD